MTTIYLNDLNVNDKIKGNSFSISQERANFGQVLINSIPMILGINIDNFWNPSNYNSPFYGTENFNQFTITIENFGNPFYQGRIKNIVMQPNRTAQIFLETETERILQQNVIISTINSNFNPAELFIYICNLYNLQFDSISTLKASAYFSENLIFVRSIILSPENTLISLFEKIAQLTCSSIYSIGNVLYFDFFESPILENPVIELTNSHIPNTMPIHSRPNFSLPQKAIITGYEVTYVEEEEEFTTQLGDQTNSMSISGGLSDLVTLIGLNSAIFVGETWTNYLAIAENSIRFNINAEIASQLILGLIVSFEIIDEIILQNYYIKQINFRNNASAEITLIGYPNA